jgi:Holliday junction resolvasome RuvABC endonuclease subunit
LLVCGLDVDTKRATYSLWDGRRAPMWGELHTKEDLSVITHSGCRTVYIEEIPFSPQSGFQVMKKLCEAVGNWQARILQVGLDYRMVPVSKWKSLACSNGSASKEEVKRIIMLTTNLPDGLPQHCYDACAISIAGYGLEKLAGVLPS